MVGSFNLPQYAHNTFNNVAFGLPDFITTQPIYGQILSAARSPRIMQSGFE
ncbi:MAG: hypothetical protein ABSF46_14300 [Terriglobia bacterium]|jgi:hypothetical protein